MDSLPEDIFLEIFLLLSVKSLLRSKLVCKSWRSRISNPEFVKRHVARTTNNPNHDLFIVNDIYNKNQLFVIDVNSLKARRLSLPDVEKLSYVVASCNGLLCLADRAKELYLWNPVTRQVKNLLGYKYTDGYVVFGFGFDHATSDYKAVRIVQKFDDIRVAVNQVEMYSLNMNCWMEIRVELEIGLVYESRYGVPTVNGSIYWLARKEGLVVISFNVQSLNFCVIQLPNDLSDHCCGGVYKFKESVALCYQFDQGLEIYTLLDGKCWSKELTIKSLDYYFIGCLRTGELIVWKSCCDDQGVCSQDIVFHDYVNDVVKYIQPKSIGCRTLYHYTESLLDLI